MKKGKLLWVGNIGSAIAALCCFTPVLVVLLGIVGLSAAVGYLDYVLLPALAACRTIWAEAKIWSFEVRFWLI